MLSWTTTASAVPKPKALRHPIAKVYALLVCVFVHKAFHIVNDICLHIVHFIIDMWGCYCLTVFYLQSRAQAPTFVRTSSASSLPMFLLLQRARTCCRLAGRPQPQHCQGNTIHQRCEPLALSFRVCCHVITPQAYALALQGFQGLTMRRFVAPSKLAITSLILPLRSRFFSHH